MPTREREGVRTEAPRVSSRWSTVVLVALLASVAVVPAAASDPSAAQLRATRLAIGFYEMPADLDEGGRYQSELIVRSIPAIGVIAIKTFDPEGFRVRALADPNVKYLRNDDAVPLLLERAGDPPYTLATPSDPQYASMYGPQQVRANLAWDTTMGDMDAAVCIIDTGVRRTHEDLGTARYLGGYDLVNDDSDPSDDHGHGTHVAGTAVGTIDNGLGVSGMGNTGYYAVKVLDSAGSGSYSNVAAAVTWCADNGIARTVLSLSLGGTGSDPSVESAIHYAFATQGMLVVAASGNGYCSDCVTFPGRHPEAIGVACTTSAVESCSFTSKGPEVDIAAPGASILSTCYSSDTAYCTKSGTSMSTPHVSGILALVWSHETTLSAAQLWQRLNETAKDVGDSGKDSTFGWGRIDAHCLITNTLCGLPPPPTLPGAPVATVTAGPSPGTLNVSWTRPQQNGSNITQYTVYRATSAAGPFDALATARERWLQESGLAAGTTMFYKVSATNGVGEGPMSAAVGNVTLDVPDAPTELGVTSGNGELSLTWSAGPDGGTPITGYRIYRASDASGPFTFRADSSTAAFTDTGLGEAAHHWYRVSAVNIVGEGAQGTDATARTFARPTAPIDLTARPGRQLFSIDLTWSAPDDSGGTPVTHYHIYRDGLHIGNASVGTFRDRDIDPIEAQHYQVSAINAVGEGPKSNEACARAHPWPAVSPIPACELADVALSIVASRADRRTETA